MDRAQLLADFYRADEGNVCHLYTDGVVLVIACTQQRHKQIANEFDELELPHQSARSSDGFHSVFVIPTAITKDDAIQMFPAFADGAKDHCWEDAHTLELVTELAQLTKAGPGF